jgi:hypothetical protein
VWRVKNDAKSVPFKTIKALPDGSELVLVRESGSMLGKRRREHGDKSLPRLPDTVARLVSFTVTTRTARRVKTSVIKVLTTLLDHGEFPAPEIAALYAERWQIEIAYLHLKKTVKGTGRVLRGRSAALARQEAWALLLVHNMTATLGARAAGLAGLDPHLIPFTAVLSLIRSHVTADTCCPHCGKRPASGNDPIAQLVNQILAHPAHRDRPARTSGRTPFQRQNWHTERLVPGVQETALLRVGGRERRRGRCGWTSRSALRRAADGHATVHCRGVKPKSAFASQNPLADHLPAFTATIRPSRIDRLTSMVSVSGGSYQLDGWSRSASLRTMPSRMRPP